MDQHSPHLPSPAHVRVWEELSKERDRILGSEGETAWVRFLSDEAIGFFGEHYPMEVVLADLEADLAAHADTPIARLEEIVATQRLMVLLEQAESALSRLEHL